jgi:hypothetical protein
MIGTRDVCHKPLLPAMNCMLICIQVFPNPFLFAFARKVENLLI